MSVKTQHPPVVVTGMHRSGTSMVASLLSALSIDIGQDLLPADPNNVRGYFEDVEFLQLQRTILSASCSIDDGGHPDWGWTEHETLDPGCFERFKPEGAALIASRAQKATAWGWKDPNTTLLLDFWDDLLDDVRYVLVYRYPWDVADSMQRLGADVFLRNPEYGYRIWEYYNRRIRDFYVKHADQCLLVSTNALQENHLEFSRLISSKLGIQVSHPGLEGIQRDLFNETGGTDPLIDLVTAVWPGCTQLLSELDDLADLSAATQWEVGPVRSRLGRRDAPQAGDPVDVSVVTACYNQGVLLIDAIASVERFAPPGCELIIINDGSQHPRTLEILEILKLWGYFIVDQANVGLCATRNAAISISRGRYILPLDDDNRIRANFIQDATQVLDSSPDVGVVYGDRYDFGVRTGAQQIAEFDVARILSGNYIDACAVFRRQVWEDCGGYDPRMSPMEDWELWIHAAERGWRLHHLPFVAFDYRVRPDSLISEFQSVEALGEFRNRILHKHPGLPVDLFALFSLLDMRSALHVADQEQAVLLSSELAAALEAVQKLSAIVEQNRDQIFGKDRTIQSLRLELLEGQEHGKAQLEQLDDRNSQLERIKTSRAWRLMQWYGRIKYRLLLPIWRFLGLGTQ